MEITKGLNIYCFLNLAQFDFGQAEPSQVPQLDYTRGSGNLTRLSICDISLQFLDAIATSSSSMNFDNIDNDKIGLPAYSHHGGEMSMIKVGKCQCQIPNIHDNSFSTRPQC